MINGVLNVWKEAGFTSHDVVGKLRGILHQKKIGHTGTRMRRACFRSALERERVSAIC